MRKFLTKSWFLVLALTILYITIPSKLILFNNRRWLWIINRRKRPIEFKTRLYCVDTEFIAWQYNWQQILISVLSVPRSISPHSDLDKKSSESLISASNSQITRPGVLNGRFGICHNSHLTNLPFPILLIWVLVFNSLKWRISVVTEFYVNLKYDMYETIIQPKD